MALTGVLVLVQWMLHGRYGWTLGRLATGIRTLDVETREPVGVARIFVRTMVVAAGAVVALVGAAGRARVAVLRPDPAATVAGTTVPRATRCWTSADRSSRPPSSRRAAAAR